MSAGLAALGCGTNRFAPIGPDASCWALARRSANTSAETYPEATKPSPPALVAAAASSGVDAPPDIGAAMTGTARSTNFNRLEALIAASYHFGTDTPTAPDAATPVSTSVSSAGPQVPTA